MVEDNCLSFGDTPEDLFQIPKHLIRSAEALSSRIVDLEDVLLGMAQLRRLGEEAEIVALMTMHVPSVRLVHLAWEMLVLLADGEGVNVFDVFEEIDADAAALLLLAALHGDPFEEEEDCDCGCCDEDEDDWVVTPIR